MNSLEKINEKYFLLSHPTAEKHSRLDIAARCPVCGDSSKDKNKKRLHLYTKPHWHNDSIKCFNCSYTATPWQYFKENHSDIFPQYKAELQQTKLDSLNFLSVFEENKNDIETSFTVQTKPIPKVLFNCPKTLTDLPQEAIDYLIKRGIEPKESWKYSSTELEVPGEETKRLFNHIIIPFEINNKWYGFQAVNIKKKQYFIFLPKENNGFKVWNYYNIDINKPVFIFESIFDAMSSGLENIISSLGVSLSDEISDSIEKKIFCYDNQRLDEASYRESEKLLTKGETLMIWPPKTDSFKDFNDLRKRGVSFDKISKFIEANIYKGFEGLIKLKMN